MVWHDFGAQNNFHPPAPLEIESFTRLLDESYNVEIASLGTAARGLVAQFNQIKSDSTSHRAHPRPQGALDETLSAQRRQLESFLGLNLAVVLPILRVEWVKTCAIFASADDGASDKHPNSRAPTPDSDTSRRFLDSHPHLQLEDIELHCMKQCEENEKRQCGKKKSLHRPKLGHLWDSRTRASEQDRHLLIFVCP